MTTLYKTLLNGQSCNGGRLAWSLPRETSPGHWVPGDWHTMEGDLSLCEWGIHLTKEPYNWIKWGGEVYEAEGRDFGAESTGPHKIVCRAARLLRPVRHPQWWQDTKQCVAELPAIRWLKPDGKPDPSWKLFTRPAWAAAGAAAWAAAGDAAWTAARAAERKWQTRLLRSYLTGKKGADDGT